MEPELTIHRGCREDIPLQFMQSDLVTSVTAPDDIANGESIPYILPLRFPKSGANKTYLALSSSATGQITASDIADLAAPLILSSAPVDGSTAGIVGQESIVNAADVYKCVRKTPSKWVKLN